MAGVLKSSKATQGRGRPKGSRDAKPKKLKLRPSPKCAKDDFYKRYKDIGLLAVYGHDEFTQALISHFWNDPNQHIIATDPVPQKLANLNRKMSGLSFSMFRWSAVSPIGFIEEGMFPVVVVAKSYKEEVLKLPNPHGVEIICLEDY